MLEREIYTCRKERRCKYKQHDLDVERHVVPGVVVHEHAAYVASAFGEATESERGHICPGLVADAIDEVEDHGDPEEACEGSICGQTGGVAVDGAFDGAEVTDC